tara:strand:- start:319 stop:459 length:141 start_codon:yes stop_codon:yes gene_type:complete
MVRARNHTSALMHSVMEELGSQSAYAPEREQICSLSLLILQGFKNG